MAVLWNTNLFAGIKTSTAWFNNQTFESGYATGTDFKTTLGVTSSYTVDAQTISTAVTTVADVSGTVLAILS